jgi:hypothetical protein
MRIHFVLVGEGPSDEGLIPHLENLCIELGASEVTGISPDFQRLGKPFRRTTLDRLQAALRLEPTANLLFVHRDADSLDSAARYEEIRDAVDQCRVRKPYVPVVPVQETEAWLLLDEAAIRTVAGHPKGKRPLDLPRPRHVESIADPKEKLKLALIQASELSGRRLERFRRDFPSHRRLLLQRMPSGGALLEIPSWMRLRERLEQAIGSMQKSI